MTEPENLPVIPVVCAVLLDQRGHVLIARRPEEKHLGGLWEFPGGKVEEGETLSDALVREIREELGTEVVVESDGVDTLGAFDHALDDRIIRLYPILCRLAEGAKPPEALEHSEIRWISLDQSDEIAWAPGDRWIHAAVRGWKYGGVMSDRAPQKKKFWSECLTSRRIFWMILLGYTVFAVGVAYDLWYLALGGALLAIPAWPLVFIIGFFIHAPYYAPSSLSAAVVEQLFIVLVIGVYSVVAPRLLRAMFN